MVALRVCEALGRPIRVEHDIKDLGENTLAKLKEAIERGDKELSLALSEYLLLEGKAMHDNYVDWVYADMDWVARIYGEEEVLKLVRYARDVLYQPLFSRRAPMTLKETVDLYAEFMRAHRSGPNEMGDFNIWEESDRYVMEFDPCGGGGRKARGPLDGSGPRTGPPFNLGKTTKPYPWSWSKVGVPYYCVHCCVFNEIVPLERNGYPFRITEFPADDPSKPCYWYFYKDPMFIPEEYFERVGFKKDPSRFRE